MKFTRRTFLQVATTMAGALALGSAPVRAGSPRQILNDWVLIGPDGKVTVLLARTEIGQGVYTVLPALVAEELEVPNASVRVEMAPCAPAYFNPAFGRMYTGDSTSVVTSYVPLRVAGAAARSLLVAVAAARWKVPPEACRADQGWIHGPDGRRLGYGEAAAEASQLPPPGKVTLKNRTAWRVLGRGIPRREGRAKVTGQATFAIDFRLANALEGTVLNSPVFGGRLKSVDPTPAQAVPGVVKVLSLDDAVIVLADRFWKAERGARALKPEWEDGSNAALDGQLIAKRLQEALQSPGVEVMRTGPAPHGQRVELLFSVPPLAHAAMEPVSATVVAGADRVDVYAATQVQSDALTQVAAALGVSEQKVKVHTLLAGGSFGRRLHTDYIVQAARAAREVGQPVKLTWTREQETQHDQYRPPAMSRVEITLGDDGTPIGLSQALAVPWINKDDPRGARWDPYGVQGAKDLAYQIPSRVLTFHPPNLDLPVGFWRSVGYSFNVFFLEHALDIAAQQAKLDPNEVRRRLLSQNSRARAVLEQATWPDPLPAGRHRGCALFSGYGSICAQSAEISLDQGVAKVHRVRCALDCGIALNPDGVKAQAEGGIIFALTAVLYGRITFHRGQVEQRNFDDYRLLMLPEVPEIQVLLVDSGTTPGGVGEVAVPPLAPAVANAILAGGGGAVHSLPVKR